MHSSTSGKRGGDTEGERCSLIPLPEIPGGETDETDRQTRAAFFKRLCGLSAHVVSANGGASRAGKEVDGAQVLRPYPRRASR